jgi:signal transduction histidine kinase
VVSDNGVGLKKNVMRRKGLGLRIMTHRAGVIGGVIELQTNGADGLDVT